MRYRQDSKGSVTLEAIVSLTTFLALFVLIISISKFFMAQALIKNMISGVALEMSQYSYLYSVSTLEDLSADLDSNAGQAKGDINKLFGIYDGLNNSIMGIYQDENGKDSVKTLSESVMANLQSAANSASTLDINASKSALEDANSTANEIKARADETIEYASDFKDEMMSISKDPIGFAKSLAVVLGQQLSDRGKSIVAENLAKSMSVKYLGADVNEANEKLKSLGIEEGLEGLDFRYSQMFHSSTPTDIVIAVKYDLEVLNLLNLDTSVSMFDVSQTKAWLSGDDKLVEKKVEEEKKESEETEEIEDETGISAWEMGSFAKGDYISSQEVKSLSEGYISSNDNLIDAYNPSKNEVVDVKVIDVFKKSYSTDDKLKKEMNNRVSNFLDSLNNKTSVTVEDNSNAEGETIHKLDPATCNKKMIIVVPEGADIEHIKELKKSIEEEHSISIEIVSGYGKSPDAVVSN